MAENTPGVEARRVYVDQIDEALRTSIRPKRAPRRPRRRIEDVATRRLRDAEKLARLQRDKIATEFGEVSFTKAFNETTKTITNLLETIRRGHEAERKAFAGLTEEQLDQVFTAQLARIAAKLETDERRLMLEIWFGKEVTDVLLQTPAQEPKQP